MIPFNQAPIGSSPMGYQQNAMGFQQSPMGFQQSPMSTMSTPAASSPMNSSAVGYQHSPMGYQHSVMGYQHPAMPSQAQPWWQRQPNAMQPGNGLLQGLLGRFPGLMNRPGQVQPLQMGQMPMNGSNPGYQLPPWLQQSGAASPTGMFGMARQYMGQPTATPGLAPQQGASFGTPMSTGMNRLY